MQALKKCASLYVDRTIELKQQRGSLAIQLTPVHPVQRRKEMERHRMYTKKKRKRDRRVHAKTRKPSGQTCIPFCFALSYIGSICMPYKAQENTQKILPLLLARFLSMHLLPFIQNAISDLSERDTNMRNISVAILSLFREKIAHSLMYHVATKR